MVGGEEVLGGQTLWPKGHRNQANLNFRWVRDVAITLTDGRPANLFKLQANAQAKDHAVKEYIRSKGKKGTHTVVGSVAVPVGAKAKEARYYEEPQKFLDDADRYFSPLTSTRVWIGVKVWLEGKKFWVGWGERHASGTGATIHTVMNWPIIIQCTF
jgi:hypothetical protein